jgi:hypothetical protein
VWRWATPKLEKSAAFDRCSKPPYSGAGIWKIAQLAKTLWQNELNHP